MDLTLDINLQKKCSRVEHCVAASHCSLVGCGWATVTLTTAPVDPMETVWVEELIDHTVTRGRKKEFFTDYNGR